jgi:hypothetical protein
LGKNQILYYGRIAHLKSKFSVPFVCWTGTKRGTKYIFKIIKDIRTKD